MNISVLGCGWLGLPLAKKLIEEGYGVKGSTTQRNKMNMLSHEGISPYVIKLYEEGVQGDLASFLEGSDILIVNIPPGLRKNPQENFMGKIGRLVDFIGKSSVKKLLFISATSVYEDTSNFSVYTEKDEPNGTAINAVQLLAAEQIVKNNASFYTSIIRFGGLFGPGRHPVNYLAGRKNIANPHAPVNLIHLDDCIGLILKIIEKESWSETFNAAYPDHPTREEYYKKMAHLNSLAVPEFDFNMPSKGKIIESETIPKLLDYAFKADLWS